MVAPSLGSFEPVRQLGLGDDGSSLLARDPSSGAHVELRYLTRVRSGSERWHTLREHFLRHAVLQHPTVLAVLDADLTTEPPLVLVEWVSSERIADRLRHGPLGPRETLALGERLAHGLGALHRIGMFHGALSPSTVVLGANDLPRIDGTGLHVVPAATDAMTLACRPPEADREPLDASSDLYSLGALLLCVLLGRAPTDAELATLPPLPAGIGALLATLLSVDREARPTAAEVCLDLRHRLARPDALRPVRRTALSDTLDGPGEGRPMEPSTVHEGTTLGRFQIVKRLGEGGMGEVFQGVDTGSGHRVAIKVLRRELSEDGFLVGRFRKEARILAEVRNAFVANLLEVNVDRGVHYLAMEYVSGRTLASQLDERHVLPEREALGIAANICRALAEPHRRGIVHRDIKPENVMMVADPGNGPSLKLLDFGIARQQDRAKETQQLTREGMIVGTPMFMAPEQCSSGDTVFPATDVYALGVTLFLMIAGHAPYDGEQPVQILLKHINEPVPALTGASEATAALVARTLAKKPDERPADAGELLDEIERILRGEPADISVHPQLPTARPDAAITYTFDYDLASSPEALWPHVCNTDRMYHAIGRAPARFERRGSVDGGVELLGEARVGGSQQRWHEYPYEWVEGRRWGALTVFDQGSANWIAFELELHRRPEGGTHVRYTIKGEPRNWFARWLMAFEFGYRQRRALGRVLARIDATVAGMGVTSRNTVDPFETAAPLTAEADARVTGLLEQLRNDGVDPKVTERLGTFVRQAPDQEIARIRPLAFAQKYGLGEEQVVTAFLRATRRGLLLLMWDVLCPLCRIPSGVIDSLRNIEDHAHCAACNADFKLDFARSIEMIFRVAPTIRASELRTYCIGGPSHSPHVAAQVRLAPGERFVLALALEPGPHRLRSPQLPDAMDLRVTSREGVRRLDLDIGGALDPDAPPVTLRAGEQTLALTNVTARELVVRIERLAPREDALTAARAASFALFRQLFPDEILAPGQLVTVTNLALVVTDLADADTMFDTLGEERAFERLVRHLRVLDDVVTRHGGAVLKTTASGVVATFDRVRPAVEAALEMHACLRDDTRTADMALRVAVHQGPMIAATIHDRMDYFGQSVTLAAVLPAAGHAGEVLLSQTVACDAEIARLLDTRSLPSTARSVPGKGVATWVQALDATHA